MAIVIKRRTLGGVVHRLSLLCSRRGQLLSLVALACARSLADKLYVRLYFTQKGRARRILVGWKALMQ